MKHTNATPRAVLRSTDPVRLWEPDTATLIATFTGHTGRVNALAAVPRADGTHLLASAGIDRSVQFWDPHSHDLVATLTGHGDGVNRLMVVPRADGAHLLASASSDRSVGLWDPESIDLVATLDGHADGVSALATIQRADGTYLLVSGSSDRTVRVWNPESVSLVSTLTGHAAGLLVARDQHHRGEVSMVQPGPPVVGDDAVHDFMYAADRRVEASVVGGGQLLQQVSGCQHAM